MIQLVAMMTLLTMVSFVCLFGARVKNRSIYLAPDIEDQ